MKQKLKEKFIDEYVCTHYRGKVNLPDVANSIFDYFWNNIIEDIIEDVYAKIWKKGYIIGIIVGFIGTIIGVIIGSILKGN